jgi:Tol biopolymer transport system component
MEDAAVSVAEPPAVSIATVAPTRRPTFWIVATAVLSLIVIGAAAAYVLRYRSIPEVQVVQFSVGPPPGGFFEQGAGIIFTHTIISPDGRKLAFTARDASGKVLLWVRSLDTLNAHSLPGTDGASMPFWSADSRSIAFQSQGKLKKVDVAGGPPQTLCEAGTFRGGTWNNDNVLLIAQNNQSISRLPAGGGTPVEITKLVQGQISHRYPSFLPDGHHFLYLAGGTEEVAGIFVGSLEPGEPKRLLQADSNAVYSPTGDLLFVRQGTLLRQSFDVKRLELTGDPIPVADRISINNNLAAFSVSENGVLAYKTGGTSEVVVLSWLDRAGKLIEKVGEPGEYRGVDLSPDGKRLAVHRQDGTGGDIWIFEPSRGPMSRLTFDPSRDNSSPVWSPDGSYIAFGTAQSGKWRMYRKLANGNSSEELLSEQIINTAPMAWSGKLIVVRVVNPRTQGDESVFSFDSKQTAPLLNGPFNELVAQVSPDGKWIAYASNETGANEIYVRPFPSGEGQRQLSASGGYAPRWRKDGKELFFLAGNRFKMASVKINASGSVLNYEPPVELFDTGYINFSHSGGTYLPYVVSPDGQKFLIPRPERPDASGAGDAATTPITVIVNWAATVKR